MAFVVLASSQLFYALSVRHEEKTIFRIGLLSNIYLIGAIVIGLLLQAAVISIPVLSDAFKVNSLNSETWAFALGLSAIPLIVNELVKMIVNVFKKHITNHKTRTSLD